MKNCTPHRITEKWGWVVRLFRAGVLVSVAGLGLSGCFRQGQSTQFYMLQAMAAPESIPRSGEGPLVGLGPIRIPAYLDRAQIVVAESGQEYRISEAHRWAEHLDENIARISAQNLSNLIPSDRIVPHPWPRDSKPDIEVSLNLQEMHVDSSGDVRMTASWRLRQGKSEVVSRRFVCRLPASLTDYSVMVRQDSECLVRLNRDMADAIRALPPQALR